MNPWLMLVIAGLLECGWAIGLKYTEGFTKPVPSVLTAVAVVASFWCMSVAFRSLPVGTAYAVWVGIGAVGTAILAVILFGEPVNALRILGIALIVAGIAALKFA
jgi:quaternary ammonium compound-resistance protein SugE